jgi:HD-GYP domain-containing protein (c-di-GMP phosphodiesterase class II)
MSEENIVIIQPNLSIARIFSNLFHSSKTQIIILNSIKELSFLESKNETQLFILGYTLSTNIKEIINKVLEFNEEACFLFTPPKDISSEASVGISQSDSFITVPYDSGMMNIITKIKMSSKLTSFLTQDDVEYFPINSKLIHKLEPIHYNIYLKFSENKFTRVYDFEVASTYSILQKYLESEKESFFIKSDDIYKFLDDQIELINNNIDEVKPDPEVLDLLGVNKNSRAFSILSNLGIERITLEKTKDILAKGTLKLKKSNKIFGMIKDINKGNNFLSDHSLMLIYVSSALAKEMEINESSSYDKLIMASLLHDLTLINSDLESLHNVDFDQNTDCSKTRKRIIEYKKHPEDALMLLDMIGNLSPDVGNIVLQHHEKQDGGGFPRGISYTDITLLSTIFIVAEDFVSEIYEHNLTAENMSKVIEEFGEKYDKGKFRMVYSGLCKIISKSQNTLYTR